ncbi:MAG: hypothetical protein ABIR66_08385 [Saprospiraceae bacterium]
MEPTHRHIKIKGPMPEAMKKVLKDKSDEWTSYLEATRKRLLKEGKIKEDVPPPATRS